MGERKFKKNRRGPLVTRGLDGCPVRDEAETHTHPRAGSRNSLKGGVLGQNSSKGGGGLRSRFVGIFIY